MKKIFLFVLCLPIVLFVLNACNKDYSGKAVVTNSSPKAAISASASTIVLDSTKNASTAVTFSWAEPKYGYSADVTYTLQFDVPSDSFKAPINVAVGVDSLSKTYTVQNFNGLVYQSMSLPANVASTVLVRLKADVNINGNTGNGTPSTIPTVYSDSLAMTVTPYKIIIVYPLLWVPGDYQGWNPATAPTIAAVKSDGNYEGYINIPSGGTYEFKFTPAPTFTTSYGTSNPITLTSGVVTGDMSLTGPNNLSVALLGGGYYRLNANTNANTWTADKTTWGLVGDFNGWPANGPDFPMTYNTTTNQWIATGVQLTAGGAFKFRANADWNNPKHNFGLDANGNLEYNGNNIPVPATGKYTIMLDLSSPGNYTYSLQKN